MQLQEAIKAIEAGAEPGRAEQVAGYMKVDRPYIGTAMPYLNDLTKQWRRELSLDARVQLAGDLWQTNIHEAMIAATKLFIQARIKPDEAVWQMILSWMPDFDAWAIADHAMMAAQKRLVADPTRIDQVESWTTSELMWTRRAALVATLPWTKQNHPKPLDMEIRERVLGWAAGYVEDTEWFIQKAIAWWLRELSKHDPDRVRQFLAAYGDGMKNFARKEAGKYLT